MAMTLRLTDEQSDRLAKAAEREGISQHSAALKAIDAYTTERLGSRDDMIASILHRESGVLQRLAEYDQQ